MRILPSNGRWYHPTPEERSPHGPPDYSPAWLVDKGTGDADGAAWGRARRVQQTRGPSRAALPGRTGDARAVCGAGEGTPRRGCGDVPTSSRTGGQSPGA